jgi:multimeric flavodoxin WrbA
MLTIINGSIGGKNGNTASLIKKIRKKINKISPDSKVRILHLHKDFDWPKVRNVIKESDALIFCTGTYWDSWGSNMQQLFEKMTEIEGKKHLIGKPAGVIVTMHSVGGKEVASRMQGVLCSMGCILPPFSAFAYSYADHVAHQSRFLGKKLLDDVWRIEDLHAFLFNIIQYASGGKEWKVWDFLDTKDYNPESIWLK